MMLIDVDYAMGPKSSFSYCFQETGEESTKMANRWYITNTDGEEEQPGHGQRFVGNVQLIGQCLTIIEDAQLW